MTLLKDISKAPTKSLWKRAALGMVVSGVSTAVILFVIILVITVFPGTEEGRFVRLEQSVESNALAIEDVQLFQINNEASSKDWIQSRDDRLSLAGFLIHWEGSFNNKELPADSHFGLSVIVPEAVGGVTIYHLVSFFRTDSTSYSLLEPSERVDVIDGALIFTQERSAYRNNDLLVVDPHLGFQLVQVDFSIHDGWLTQIILEAIEVYSIFMPTIAR